jgi:SNF2 family DNA or RNA helicase
MALYEHQLNILRDDKKKVGLFLGTGSGKSLIALLLARGKTLVIAPKTQVLDGNWEREVKKNNLKIDLTVLSKETFRRDYAELPRFDTVIVDEAETCLGVTPNIRWRNKKPIPKASQLFEALYEYVNVMKPDRIYLATATITRSPMTVYGAGLVLGHNWDFYKYRDMFYTRLKIPNREIWVPKKDSLTKDKLANIVKKLGYIGRLSDYFDVPEQTYKTVYVELSKGQKERIKELPYEYPDPLVLVGKKHQVENGVLTGDEFNAPEEFENEKIEKIMDYAIEFPRMVIFARYTAQIHAIAKVLRDDGRKVLILDGSTKDRKGLLEDANSSDECIVIAQCQVSAGWELPDYPVMVFASMSYSVVDRVQSEGRILRANHLKKNLYITLVARGGIDEAVYKAINNKQDFIERLYVKGK